MRTKGYCTLFCVGAALLFAPAGELLFVAVEHIDIHLPVDTAHASFGCQLPEGQLHIGTELTVAGDPHVISPHGMRRVRQVVIDKRLPHVENGAFAGGVLHIV